MKKFKLNYLLVAIFVMLLLTNCGKPEGKLVDLGVSVKQDDRLVRVYKDGVLVCKVSLADNSHGVTTFSANTKAVYVLVDQSQQNPVQTIRYIQLPDTNFVAYSYNEEDPVPSEVSEKAPQKLLRSEL